MPTASDLVTDLPADFEVFGQAVDTSLADLKGGTTDQVLAKNSNTDMDFKWVTSDDANAIQNAIVDAKGDLIAASANDTPARLAVGNNGETLVADSSTSTGLRYSSGMRVENPIINSAFDVAQRGTSFTTNTTLTQYSLDRWVIYCPNTNATVSQQATNDTTNLPTIRYCARIQRNSGATNLNNIYIMQNVETSNAIRFAGQTVTMSYWARAGANFSAASSFIETQMYWGTGVDQNVFNYTGATSATNNQAITTTWTRYSITYSFPATATEFCPRFSFLPVGTAGANDWFEITGIQLDIGSVALPYRRNGATIQGELAACQRYYLDTRNGTDQPFSGYSNSTDYLLANVRYPVTMRTTPSVTIGQASGSNYVRRISTNAQIAITVTSYPGTNPGGFSAVYAVAAPFVAAVGYDFYILASAEL